MSYPCKQHPYAFSANGCARCCQDGDEALELLAAFVGNPTVFYRLGVECSMCWAEPKDGGDHKQSCPILRALKLLGMWPKCAEKRGRLENGYWKTPS